MNRKLLKPLLRITINWRLLCLASLFVLVNPIESSLSVAQDGRANELVEEFELSTKQQLMIRRLESKGARFRKIQERLTIELSYDFAVQDDKTQFSPLVMLLKNLPVKGMTIYGGKGVPKEQFEDLLKNTELETLSLINFVGDTESLALVAEQDSLTRLTIQSNNLTSEVLQSYAKLENLRSLALFGLQQDSYDSDTLTAIGDLNGLTSLCLMQVELGRTECDAICKLTSLQGISLVACSWDDDAWHNLSELRNVSELLFNDCAIDLATAKSIGSMSEIIGISFFQTDVNDEKFETIIPCFGSLPDEQSILSLNLSGTQITGSSLEKLFEAKPPFEAASIIIPEDLEKEIPLQSRASWDWNTQPRNPRNVGQ